MLSGVISVSDLLLNDLFRGALTIAGHQFHKFVLHVLDEVQASFLLVLDHEDGQVLVRLTDACVQHADQHVRVLSVVHHEFLLLLHQVEVLHIDAVREVEEQVVLGRHLEADGVRGVVCAREQHLHLDGLQRARADALVARVVVADLHGNLKHTQSRGETSETMRT